MDALLLKRGDLASVAAIDNGDLRIAVDFLHEPHAPRAQDAAVPIEHQRGTEIDVGFHAFAVEDATRKIHPAFGGPERVRKILKRTLAPFVADRAVERMMDQKKLKDAGTCVHNLGIL